MTDSKQYYRVLKADSGQFWVDVDGRATVARARSRLKKDSVIVGDFVTLEKDAGEPVISDVNERRNRLIRPSVANIDCIIVMVAAVPKVDFLLIDKLIINAALQGIEVVICFNKTDISSGELPALIRDYSPVVSKIVQASALSGKIDEVTALLNGKLTCIAGQSAVGKSTFVNELLGYDGQRTGDLSKKIQRGKNTTTASEIFAVAGGYVVDTPGFSLVDISGINPEEINLYYHEFDEFRQWCKFSTCTHTSEPECRVKEAAKLGEISIDRYQRYLRIYSEIKELYDRNTKLRKTKKE